MNDFDDLQPERERQFLSVGATCCLFNISPARLAALMREMELRFAQICDGVPYLFVADAERIGEKCVESRRELEEKFAYFRNN